MTSFFRAIRGNRRCIFLGWELPPAVSQGRKSPAVAPDRRTQRVEVVFHANLKQEIKII